MIFSFKRILILEDDLYVLSKLLEKLYQLETDQLCSLSLVIVTDYQQVEKLINVSDYNFDIILLDRDDKLNKSFHILDIERLGVEKVIGISSVTAYNEELKKRGVTKVIEKNIANIPGFVEQVFQVITKMIAKEPLV